MKPLISILIVLFVTASAVLSFADTASKFKGGIRDVIMSPFQVSDKVKEETTNAKFLPFALVGGLLKGTFYMAKQIVTGTLQVATAPIEMIHK